MGYKDRQQKQSNVGNSNLVTTSLYDGGLWRPAWSNEVRLETHFRPTGPMTDDTTNFKPWRLSADTLDLEDFIVPVQMFTGGTFKISNFIASYGLEDNSITVAHAFAISIKKMSYNDEEVKKLMDARIPFCRPPVDNALVQCILFRHGKYDYYNNPKFPTMLQLTKSARSSFEKIMEERDSQGYVCEDMLDADKGCVFTLYNPNTVAVSSGKKAVGWGSSGDSKSEEDKTTGFRYTCEVIQDEDNPTGQFRPPIPRNEDGTLWRSEDLFTPWEKCLNFLTEPEMVNTLCEAYQTHPHILKVALDRYKEHLPKFVRGDATVTRPAPEEEVATEGPPKRQEPKKPVGWGSKPPAPKADAGESYKAGIRQTVEEQAPSSAEEEAGPSADMSIDEALAALDALDASD